MPASVASYASRWARLFLASIFLIPVTAMAAENPSWVIRSWQTDDGLPNNKITAVVQSQDGYLWLALPHDLVRFDGVRFTKFPLDPIGAPESSLWKILSRRDGGLWVEPTGRGLVYGLNADFSHVAVPPMAPVHPATMVEDAEGSLWLASATRVCRVKNTLAQQFTSKDGVPPDGVNDLVTDGAGNVWLAKGKKICVFQGGQFRSIANFSLQGTVHMAATHTNKVWISAGPQLFQCDLNGTLEPFGEIPSAAAAPPTPHVMIEDHLGAVWIGTDGDGLFRFSETGFEKIEGIYPYISSLLEDREGNIWAGTSGGGLDRISRGGIRLEGIDHSSLIVSICEDANGIFWAATQNRQLVFRSDGKWNPVPDRFDLPRGVTSVAAGANGGLWFGTTDGKVYSWLTNDIKSWDTETGHRVVAVRPDSHGDLWIAEYGTSIHRIHDGKLNNVKLPANSGRISAIGEDTHGTLWIGSDRGRLFHVVDGQFINQPNVPISGRTVCCFGTTPDNSLWIGYSGGLVRFKDGRFAQVGTEEGLPDDYISQVVADNDGWLWFGTDHGIFKVRQDELNKIMDGQDGRIHAVTYGRNEGLISLEGVFSTASPFIFPNGFRSHDGRVWLLMRTGIAIADPQILRESPGPLPVFITRVSVDNQTAAAYGNPDQSRVNLKTLRTPIDLPPGHHKLEFEFTALNFTAPENVHFRYRLDGLDDDWVDADTRSASYTRLTAGNYRFRVEASKDNGPWNEVANPPAIVVPPFFWQTWPFQLSVVLFFTLLVISIVRYVSFRRLRLKLQRLEQQAALDKERTRIARDIHDDLGSSMTQIMLLSGLTARHRTDPAKVNDHVQQISFAARHVTDALDEIVWAVNPRNDTLPHLINYIGAFTSEFLSMTGIKYRIDLPPHPTDRFVSTEARHNLFLVVKEALNNIARHSAATEASLQVATDDQVMRIVIQDNGRGFNGAPDNGCAEGLRNMDQRMIEIGGAFQVESKPGDGTIITLRFPLAAAKTN